MENNKKTKRSDDGGLSNIVISTFVGIFVFCIAYVVGVLLTRSLDQVVIPTVIGLLTIYIRYNHDSNKAMKVTKNLEVYTIIKWLLLFFLSLFILVLVQAISSGFGWGSVSDFAVIISFIPVLIYFIALYKRFGMKVLLISIILIVVMFFMRLFIF